MSIINGDFETGNLDGWTIWGIVGTGGQSIVQANTSSKHSGVYGCQIHVHGGSGNGSTASLLQKVNFSKFYCDDILIGYFKFWLNIIDSSYDQGSGCRLTLSLSFSGDLEWYNETTGWQQVTVLPLKTDYHISLYMSCDMYHVMNAYVDDFEFITNKKSITSKYSLAPDRTPVSLIGINSIQLYSPINLISIEDIIGTSHPVSLVGIAVASHGVASTFRWYLG